MKEIDDKIFEYIDNLKLIGEIKFDADVYRLLEMSKQRYYDIKNFDDRHFTVRDIKILQERLNLNVYEVFQSHTKTHTVN